MPQVVDVDWNEIRLSVSQGRPESPGLPVHKMSGSFELIPSFNGS
jgi:hypothetical protein